MTRRRVAAVVATTALIGSSCLLAPPAQAAVIPAPGDPVTHEENPRVTPGAAWSEAYLPSTDGVELHADILRPAGLKPTDKTPVILSVGPYFAHAGQTEDEGFSGTGPSERFYDFIEGAGLMAKGYTFVMVDLRGFGGSTGCLDWVGPGEQADVKAAVDWSTKQSWSNGKVGMYGKSYDASTGLVGANQQRTGLKAVVAQEPVWDMYNYLFSNKVRRPNYLGTPLAYNSIASVQGLPDDSARYKRNAGYEKTNPQCLSDNVTDPQNPNPNSGYWRARNLAAQASGSTVPLFVTQGFIEPNTKPEDMETYLDNHTGPERGWLGQWEHVRGNEVGADGRLRMGRAGWFAEVMRFYDQYLKGTAPATADPAFSVEDNLGQWRAQRSWPTPSQTKRVALGVGSYVDDGGQDLGDARATASRAGVAARDQRSRTTGRFDLESAPSKPQRVAAAAPTTSDSDSYYTWSKPVRTATRITGTPRVALDTSGAGNVLVRLWDVSPAGKAVLFDEQMSVVKGGSADFDLKSTDWTLATGHQLVVGIGTNTSGSWADTPSIRRIKVTGASLTLDVQRPETDVATDGDRSPYLDSYLRAYTATWSQNASGSFTVPGANRR